MRIFNLTQLSRVGSPYWSNLLVSSIYFWEGSSNTFQFLRGMFTPTLFDIAAIIGLHLTGEVFYPLKNDGYMTDFDKDYAGLTKYMECYHEKTADKVYDI